jgi:hypothetical protein
VYGGDWDGADDDAGGGDFALLAGRADQPVLFRRGECDAGDHDQGGAVMERLDEPPYLLTDLRVEYHHLGNPPGWSDWFVNEWWTDVCEGIDPVPEDGGQ